MTRKLCCALFLLFSIKFKWLFVVMALSLLMACGDSEENGNTKNVDGVNVTKGKKIVELSFIEREYGRIVPNHIKVDYDSNGRLSRIMTEQFNYIISDNGNETYNFTSEYSEVLSIDYDSRLIKIPVRKRIETIGFVLNEDGYVSLLGKTIFNYDENGYLTGADEPKSFTSLLYNKNDIIRAETSLISSGDIKYFFVTYSNNSNNGDIYVRVSRSSNEKYRSLNLNSRAVLFLIAYQAGLFGKVSNTVINLKNKSEADALFDYYYNDNEAQSGTISFVLK